MIVVITYSVKDRFLGYFSSCMNEISSGVFVSMITAPPFRVSLLDTISRWWNVYNEGSIVVLWYDKDCSSKINFQTFGNPKRDLVDFENILLTKIN